MPAWVWIALLGALQTLVAGLVVAIRSADQDKIRSLEERLVKSIDELREWKHTVVDPYIPRAIDEHERRINRLDSRVFNGGPK